MSNEQNTPPAPETPTPPKSPTERLAYLEKLVEDGVVKTVVRIVQDLNAARAKLDMLERTAEQLVAYINGIERVFSEDKAVTKETLRDAILANRIDQKKAEVAMYVERGILKKASDAVTQQSFVVYREVDGDDKVLNPRDHLEVASLAEDMRNKLLLQRVGNKVNVLPGRFLELLEVYEVVPPPAPKAATPAPAAQPVAETPKPAETTQEPTNEKESD